MNSDMVKPEKYNHLQLVCSFRKPINLQINLMKNVIQRTLIAHKFQPLRPCHLQKKLSITVNVILDTNRSLSATSSPHEFTQCHFKNRLKNFQ